MTQRGFILPLTIILALVILTSLGLWYRQTVLQSFLAERLLKQRGGYIECRSLIPVLKARLDGLSLSQLHMDETDFLVVDLDHRPRWRIDRSAWTNNRVRFVFRRSGSEEEPLALIVPYNRSAVSSLPPDFAAERGRVLPVRPSER